MADKHMPDVEVVARALCQHERERPCECDPNGSCASALFYLGEACEVVGALRDRKRLLTS